MKKDDVVQIINKEIRWALDHPATNLSKDFQDGYAAGLNQAILLVTRLDEALSEQDGTEGEK